MTTTTAKTGRGSSPVELTGREAAAPGRRDYTHERAGRRVDAPVVTLSVAAYLARQTARRERSAAIARLIADTLGGVVR